MDRQKLFSRYAVAVGVVALSGLGMWMSTATVKGASTCYVYCNIPQGHQICVDDVTSKNKTDKNKNYFFVTSFEGKCLPEHADTCSAPCE